MAPAMPVFAGKPAPTGTLPNQQVMCSSLKAQLAGDRSSTSTCNE